MTEKLKSVTRMGKTYLYDFKASTEIPQAMGITGRPPYEPEVNVPHAVGINYSTPKPKKLYNKGSKYHK